MAHEAKIEPASPASDREGGGVLDMEDPRDIALLRRTFTERWKTSSDRQERYLSKLDKVVESTEDERIIVAAASVSVSAMRANTDAIKALRDKAELHLHNHNELHVHGGRELPGELSVEELRKLAALDQGRQQGQGAEGGTGGEGNPPQRPDADPLQDRPQ
ncbi:MAG: hypothetical protein KDB90_17750 [Planctomycetes bacterium]|nr:hypothetical protein [Planctomycetota bacterium]